MPLITCILGPSGSGKTTLLRRAKSKLHNQGWRVLTEPNQIPNRPPIDILTARGMTLEVQSETGAVLRMGMIGTPWPKGPTPMAEPPADADDL